MFRFQDVDELNAFLADCVPVDADDPKVLRELARIGREQANADVRWAIDGAQAMIAREGDGAWAIARIMDPVIIAVRWDLDADAIVWQVARVLAVARNEVLNLDPLETATFQSAVTPDEGWTKKRDADLDQYAAEFLMTMGIPERLATAQVRPYIGG